jgi:hypothetical protein
MQHKHLRADQDILQPQEVNWEAEGLHEPYALEIPPFVMELTHHAT